MVVGFGGVVGGFTGVVGFTVVVGVVVTLEGVFVAVGVGSVVLVVEDVVVFGPGYLRQNLTLLHTFDVCVSRLCLCSPRLFCTLETLNYT